MRPYKDSADGLDGRWNMIITLCGVGGVLEVRSGHVRRVLVGLAAQPTMWVG
jgi:hypothetical protein